MSTVDYYDINNIQIVNNAALSSQSLDFDVDVGDLFDTLQIMQPRLSQFKILTSRKYVTK